MKYVHKIKDGLYLQEHFSTILGNLITIMNTSQTQQPNRNYWKGFFQEFVHDQLEQKIRRQLGNSNWAAPAYHMVDSEEDWPKGKFIFLLILFILYDNYIHQ